MFSHCGWLNGFHLEIRAFWLKIQIRLSKLQKYYFFLMIIYFRNMYLYLFMLMWLNCYVFSTKVWGPGKCFKLIIILFSGLVTTHAFPPPLYGSLQWGKKVKCQELHFRIRFLFVTTRCFIIQFFLSPAPLPSAPPSHQICTCILYVTHGRSARPPAFPSFSARP